jgi:hypothetical protein
LHSKPNRRADALGFLFGLLALTASVAPAAAFEAKLWPLFDVVARERETRVSLLGPLVEWRSDDEGSSFALRPLFTTSTGDAGRTASFLYPVATWDADSAGSVLRVLGMASYARTRADAPGAEGGGTALEIFPLLFFRSGAAGTSFSLIPLYADLERFFGYERVRMLLFPLYLRLEEPLWHRTYLPFPFVSWLGGRAGGGFRVWPLWGRTVEGAQRDTRYLFWPFWIRRVEHPGRADAVTTRIVWPLFSSIEGPTLRSRSWSFLPLVLLPLYTHTVDLRTDREIIAFPWPAEVVERERSTGRRLSLRLAPFWQDRTSGVLRSRFVMWPFYRHREGLGDDAGYRRTDVLFFLYRSERAEEAGEAVATDVLVPFWRSRGSEHRGSAQALTFLDGLFPTNDKLAAAWAPLYRLYGEERDETAVRRDVLWRMWEWGGGKVRPPWYLSAGS